MFRTRFLLTTAPIIALLAGGPLAAAEQKMSPQNFANAAAQSDAYEIAAGQVAVTQTQNERVRTFARQMIEDHTQTSSDLQKAVTASRLQPPAKILGADQAQMLSALQSMKGDDFDRAYVTQQVLAHTSALVTEQSYAVSGSDPNLRKAAQSAAPMIQRHLEIAQRLKSAMPPMK